MKITLKAARINAGMTLETAANSLEVSVQTLVNWEKNLTEPSISQAYKIASLYKMDIDNINFF